MTDSPDHNRTAGDSPTSGDSPTADEVDNKSVTWAFALQALGIVVGLPWAFLSAWAVAFCSGLCQTINSHGFWWVMVLAPVAVPFLCLIASALVCLPARTERRRSAVWVITWAGAVIVTINFIITAG